MAFPTLARPASDAEPRRLPARWDVLEALDRALDDVARGIPRCALLIGPTGIGKTRALEEAAARAAERDFRVVNVQATSRHLRLLTSIRVAEALGIPDEPGRDAAALLQAVRLEIERSSRSAAPLAVIVDDLGACSPEDLALLRDLAQRPPADAFLLLLSARGTEMPAIAASVGLTEWGALEHLGAIELEPLDAAGCAALAHARPSLEGATAAFTDALHALSAGFPRHADALLDGVEQLPAEERAQVLLGSRPLESLPLPRALKAAMLAEVAHVSAEQRRVLRALSVWHAPASLPTLAALTEQAADVVAAGVERLEDEGVLRSEEVAGEIRFQLWHPLLAAAVREEIPALARARLHDRAARVLDGDASDVGDAVTRAQHYAAAAEPLEHHRIETIVEAARHLNTTSRYAQARDLLVRVMARLAREHATASLPHEAYALLAEASARLGHSDDAERLVAMARPASGGGDARARLLLRAARDHVAQGRNADAMRLYRMILDDPDLTPSMRLRVAEDAGRVTDELGQHEEARSLAAQAARDAEAIGEIELASDIWVSYHSLLHYAGESEASFRVVRHAWRLARRSGSRRAKARAMAGIGNSLADLRSLPRAVRWLRRALQEAQACGDSALLSWAAARLLEAYQEAGDWEDALAVGRLAVHTDVALHRIRSESRARALLSILQSRRGQGKEAALQMDLAASGSGDELDPLRGVSHALAAYEHAIVEQDLDAALLNIERARALMDGRPARRRTMLVEILPRLAAVGAARGEADVASEALASFEHVIAEIPGAPPLMETQLLAVRATAAELEGRTPEAIEQWRAAIAGFDRQGYRWRAAAARRALGRLLVARGELEAGVESLRTAYSTFRELGAPLMAESVNRELRVLGRRPPRTRRSNGDELTPRERQVAELAARGMRDAEIAEALFISRRTVTTHMHHALTKLELRSRHELATWIGTARRPVTQPGPDRALAALR